MTSRSRHQGDAEEAGAGGATQGWPQAKPSSHLVWGTPSGQRTVQLPVFTQCTRHVPSHVTSQLLTEMQLTSLPSPTRGAQLLTLVQAY